ncbi:MAG: metallophosphoesterase [Acidobacteriota bacterium]|nr:metallophosphoesterase [Acidobacteriota bacterium]
MKLWAISDLHIANRSNREALTEMPAFPEDWLIIAGDVGETEGQLRFALSELSSRFRQLVWVPGNHDLWSLHHDPSPLRGEEKYRRLVDICRSFGVLTPEDPYARWPGVTEDGRSYRIAPLFLLYDYSFRPPEVAADEAVDWAAESGVLCGDEILLHPDPFPSRPAWCAARVRYTSERLAQAATDGAHLILISHWPLRQDLVRLRRIPRFSIWCGTRESEDWHRRFPVAAVIYGHLHIKGTHFRDGVRFEEVSLGYPRDWVRSRGVSHYLRQILPAPDTWLDGTR